MKSKKKGNPFLVFNSKQREIVDSIKKRNSRSRDKLTRDKIIKEISLSSIRKTTTNYRKEYEDLKNRVNSALEYLSSNIEETFIIKAREMIFRSESNKLKISDQSEIPPATAQINSNPQNRETPMANSDNSIPLILKELTKKTKKQTSKKKKSNVKPKIKTKFSEFLQYKNLKNKGNRRNHTEMFGMHLSEMIAGLSKTVDPKKKKRKSKRTKPKEGKPPKDPKSQHKEEVTESKEEEKVENLTEPREIDEECLDSVTSSVEDDGRYRDCLQGYEAANKQPTEQECFMVDELDDDFKNNLFKC